MMSAIKVIARKTHVGFRFTVSCDVESMFIDLPLNVTIVIILKYFFTVIFATVSALPLNSLRPLTIYF